MSDSFKNVYNSKSKFLQRYIVSILQYNKREDFIREVLYRAWRMYPSKRISFDKVREYLDAKFTDAEMQIILTEKEKLASIKRLQKNHSENYENYGY